MPTKSIIDQVPAQVWALTLSFIMSFLRVYMDKSETKILRILSESFICVGLTFAAVSIIKAMGLDENYQIAAGVFIGYIGTHSIRILAIKLAEKKIGGQ
ncbi:MAG: phage holin, lambda family [Pseudoalteromonas sp.]